MRYDPRQNQNDDYGAGIPFDQQIEGLVRNDMKVYEGKLNTLAGDAKAYPFKQITDIIGKEQVLILTKVDGNYNNLFAPVRAYISEIEVFSKLPKDQRLEHAKNSLQKSTNKKIAKVKKEEQVKIPLKKQSQALGEHAREIEKMAEDFENAQKDKPADNIFNKNGFYVVAQGIVGTGEIVANYFLLQNVGGINNGAIPFLVIVISAAMAYSGHRIPEAIFFKKKKALRAAIVCGALALTIPIALRLFYASEGGIILLLFPPLLFALGLSLGFARKWAKYFKWMKKSSRLYAERDDLDTKVEIIEDDAKEKIKTIQDEQDIDAKTMASESTIQTNLAQARSDLDTYQKRKKHATKQIKKAAKLATEQAAKNAARTGKSNLNGKSKSNAGKVFLIALLGSVFFLNGCGLSGEPKFIYEVAIQDVTDSHFEKVQHSVVKDKLTLPSEKKVSVNKHAIKLSFVNDKHMQVYFSETLDYAEPYLQRDEKARLDTQAAFTKDVLQAFTEFPTTQKTGLSESFVFQSIKTHANALARSMADIKRLHIWSDLCENSPPFSIYDHIKNPREIFEDGNEQKIIKKLDEYFSEEKYADWQGLEVTIYYNPDKATDELYTAARMLFRTWLESHNAQVLFEVMT